MRTAIVFLLTAVAATSTLSRAALAQGNSGGDVAKADALFRNAKDAAARGDLTAACAGFEESQRLDPATGTLLNLADCEARSGKPDAALGHFEAARDQMTPGDGRRQYALDQIAALAPKPAAGAGTAMGETQRDAVVAPRPHDNGFSVAAMVGYASDEMSVGLGARVGKVVFSHVYLGASFVYQFGESTGGTTGATPLGTPVSASSSITGYYVGPEAGYEFEFAVGGSTIVLRPYVGLGLYGYTTSTNVSGDGVSNTSSSVTQNGFVVWPGAVGLYRFPGSAFFASLDFRAATIPGGPAWGSYVGGGMGF